MAEEESIQSGDQGVVDNLKTELNSLLGKVEKMWHQRSQVQWLQCGDRNTKFFHGTATRRKRRNFIKELQDENGIWQSEEHIFSGLLTDFYEKLFTSSNPHNMDQIVDGVQEVVTDHMKGDLAKPYTADEVDSAIKEMAPSKAQGQMECPHCSTKLIGRM